jgi:dTDP-4-amino-4,6-dideoxygalactose transaminase
LDELQAAILRVKLRYLEEENRRRQFLAAVYNEVLSTTSLVLPQTMPETSHVYHQYAVRSENRDGLRQFLHERGIGTLIHYPVPVHRQPAYRGRLRCAESMVISERVATEILSLPMYPELTTDQVRRIGELVVNWRLDSSG